MTYDDEPGGYVEDGDFKRDTHYLTTRITADGGSGFAVAPDRYRLVVSRACPWANRSIVTRRLLGLEDAISMGVTGPTHGWKSWRFDLDPGGRDPVLGIERLRDAYLKTDPDYDRGVTVPAMVEIATGAVVTNDYDQLIADFATEWSEHHRPGAPDLYPPELRDEIEALNAVIYPEVNDGVYRCGFAGSQDAYEESYERLFGRLDWLSKRLTKSRYLAGDHITLADVRLFPTLVRFDAVYHNHFKCNRNKLTEQGALWDYARDLFQTPGFGDTVDFAHIKAHYYLVHTDINPTGIVPAGPDTSVWLRPHDRESLGGSPFGDGTPPPPPPPDERVDPAHTPLPMD